MCIVTVCTAVKCNCIIGYCTGTVYFVILYGIVYVLIYCNNCIALYQTEYNTAYQVVRGREDERTIGNLIRPTFSSQYI